MPIKSTINQIAVPQAERLRRERHRLFLDKDADVLGGLRAAVERACQLYDKLEPIDRLPASMSFSDPKTRGLMFYQMMIDRDFDWDRFTRLGARHIYDRDAGYPRFLRPTKRHRRMTLEQNKVDFALAGFNPASHWDQVSKRTRSFLSARTPKERARLRKMLVTASPSKIVSWRRRWDAAELFVTMDAFFAFTEYLRLARANHRAQPKKYPLDEIVEFRKRYGAEEALVARLQLSHLTEEQVIGAIVATAQRLGVTDSFIPDESAARWMLHAWTAYGDTKRSLPRNTPNPAASILCNTMILNRFLRRVRA